MDMMRAAARLEAEGRRVVHMEVGQPGTPAPRAARDALRRALDTEPLGYTLALGTDALRERIARHYAEAYGQAIPASRVIVTSGSSAGFVLAFLALFDPGDRVALPSPGYPCYRHILAALGAEPVAIETGDAGRWMPTAADIAGLPDRMAGLLVASPANPTGTMISRQRLAEIAAACRARGMWLVSDEIYHGLTYGMDATTALAVADDAVVVNSFSKFYSMTGWRVGWLVVPEHLVRPIERLAQNLYISPPAPAQAAALVEGLRDLGLGTIAPADGAFYVYADVSHLTSDSREWTRLMLDEAAVATTPGLDFDAARGHRFVRFSYAGTTTDMEEALDRLARWPRLKR
jgi:aspartate/methionine/tyrosine aminotransferase